MSSHPQKEPVQSEPRKDSFFTFQSSLTFDLTKRKDVEALEEGPGGEFLTHQWQVKSFYYQSFVLFLCFSDVMKLFIAPTYK